MDIKNRSVGHANKVRPSENFFNGLGMHKLLVGGWWEIVDKCGQPHCNYVKKSQGFSMPGLHQRAPGARALEGLESSSEPHALHCGQTAPNFCPLTLHKWANFYCNLWVMNSRKTQLCKILFSLFCHLIYSHQNYCDYRKCLTHVCELRSLKLTTITKSLNSIKSANIQRTPLCMHLYCFCFNLTHEASSQ